MFLLEPAAYEIPKKAYLGDRRLTEVLLPYGVTKLSDWAFAGCKNLELVALPDTVQVLGKDVFLNCNQLKRILIFDKQQQSGLQKGNIPLWNTKKSIWGELLMYAVCWLKIAGAIAMFSESRMHFSSYLREQISVYIAMPDEEGFSPFLAGGEEDYDDVENDISYYCERTRIRKVRMLGRYLLLTNMCPQDCVIKSKEREQWVAYMKAQKETFLLFHEEQYLIKELFVLYEELGLFNETIVSRLLKQTTEKQVELRALLLRKQEEYRGKGLGWEKYEL